MIWLWASLAAAVDVDLSGDVKTFGVVAFPYEWVALDPASEAALGLVGLDPVDLGFGARSTFLGIASGRLKLRATAGPLRLDAHHVLVGRSPAEADFLPGAGAAPPAPQAVDLDWEHEVLSGRTDRLALSWRPEGWSVALGRQPLTFGTGLVFTPMDVVNPFHPATIDTEYKPGVDALRVDRFLGVGGRLTLVAAWVGPPIADPVLWADGILAATGQTTVGLTDLHGFAGVVRTEPVIGVGVASAVGGIGVHGDATLTLGEAPFVRSVAGAVWRPTPTTTLTGEAYLQTFGAARPEGYLEVATSDRFARGEVWQMGRYYASLSVAEELTPLIGGTLALVANLADPSALGVLGLTWSVADEAVVSAGAYLGLGARPDRVEVGLDGAGPTLQDLAPTVRSEFGLYPHAAYVQMSAYF